MKRRKRVIQDDFPDGLIDRDEARRVFAELREKRLARERRAAARAVEGSASEVQPVRRQAAS
jgi:hypothetical protein